MVNLSTLETLARAATPQDFDSAEYQDLRGGDYVECPACGGEGQVEVMTDYCNYDGAAIGVQFYGVGPERRSAEEYYRAANPDTILALCEIIREQHEALKDMQSGWRYIREQHGEDWNAGTAAKMHRQDLIRAVEKCKAMLAGPPKPAVSEGWAEAIATLVSAAKSTGTVGLNSALTQAVKEAEAMLAAQQEKNDGN